MNDSVCLKCYVCKENKPKIEFQTFKSCQTCRKRKRDKRKEKDFVPISSFTTEQYSENRIESKGWCYLSSKWIKKGEEKVLHNCLMKNLHYEFLTRCSFPLHKYLTKDCMKDIRRRIKLNISTDYRIPNK